MGGGTYIPWYLIQEQPVLDYFGAAIGFLLTIPLTLITFGFFLLFINALMMQLVAWLVPGFKVSGFWIAFFASIFIAVLSFLVGLFIFKSGDNPIIIPQHQSVVI